MTNDRERLMIAAKQMLDRAYAKHSNLRVGAALLGEDGKIYTGCNVENISYGLTICAERTAIFKAVSEGIQKFKAIAITSSNFGPIYPCGACRQVLAEFGDIDVYVENDPRNYKLSELLPNSFQF